MNFAHFAEQHGRRETAASGAHLFRAGDDVRSLFVVRKGLLKAYYLTPDGGERVKSFLLEGDLIASLTSAYRHEGCSFHLVALEDSELLRLEFDALHDASRSDLALATAVTDFLLDFGLKKERRERELLTLDAEQRYLALLEQSPDLPSRVRQKDLARYLGITPEALSRLRSRLRS